MKYPSHIKAVFLITFMAVILLFSLFGALGYIVYGNHLRGSITLNLTSTKIGTVT